MIVLCEGIVFFVAVWFLCECFLRINLMHIGRLIDSIFCGSFLYEDPGVLGIRRRPRDPPINLRRCQSSQWTIESLCVLS